MSLKLYNMLQADIDSREEYQRAKTYKYNMAKEKILEWLGPLDKLWLTIVPKEHYIHIKSKFEYHSIDIYIQIDNVLAENSQTTIEIYYHNGFGNSSKNKKTVLSSEDKFVSAIYPFLKLLI